MNRHRIEDIFRNLDSFDAHALLQVKPKADVQQLRQAYYQQCRLWHPDQFIHQNFDAALLEKIETIFSAIARAYRSLRTANVGFGDDGVVRASVVPGSLELSEDTLRDAEEALRARLQELMMRARAEAQANQQRAHGYFEQGQRAMVEYDFHRAVSAFESALHLVPYNGMYREYYQLALQQRRSMPERQPSPAPRPRAAPREDQEKIRDAIRHYRQRIEAGSQDGRLFARLGHLLRWFDGELSEASRCLQQAILLEPDNAEYRVSLGELYAEQREDRRALREFCAALGLAQDARTRSRAQRGLEQLRG
ncbi:MAG: DnaJ domain-containing protein [Myxococcota bacterium]